MEAEAHIPIKDPEPDRDRKAWFCSFCFASDSGGSSWGEDATQEYCFNCSSGGTAISIPVWAVEAIRKNASWVGRRYYPCDEDWENYHELMELRALVPTNPGRSVRRFSHSETGEVFCSVEQDLFNGRRVSMGADDSKSDEELLAAYKTKLPYRSGKPHPERPK